MVHVDDDLHLGLSPYDPDAPRPYKQALCAPFSDISSGEPCSFSRISGGPWTQTLNVLWVQDKGTQICIFFSLLSKLPVNETPPGSRLERAVCLQGLFTYLISHKNSPN